MSTQFTAYRLFEQRASLVLGERPPDQFGRDLARGLVVKLVYLDWRVGSGSPARNIVASSRVAR